MGETNRTSRPPMLQNLHKLRGLAALTVVVSHLTHWHGTAVMDRFDKMICFGGTYAVGVFFVISGFIIAHSHRRDIGQPGRLRAYAIKRFFRIFPAYWAYSLLFLLLGAAGVASWDQANLAHRNGAELVSAILLVPLSGVTHGYLAVSWSLYYEIIFYCVFVAFFINRRAGFAALGLFIACSVMRHTNPLTDPHCFNRINLLFLAGVLMGLYADRVVLDWLPPMALTLGGVGCYAWSVARTVQMNSHYISMAAVLLVAGAVMADFRRKETRARDNLANRVLMGLGTVSYSLYLCHVPVQSMLHQWLGSPYSAPWIAVMYVLVPCGGAWAGYRLIEKPAQNLGRALTRKSRALPVDAHSPIGTLEPARSPLGNRIL